MSTTTAQSLFERHHLRIFRFLRRLSGSRHEAEDLTQEVFLRAARSLHAYRPEGRELAWLLQIARNLWTDRHRRDSRRPQLVELPRAMATKTTAQDRRLSLQQALESLPEAEREAFLMREIGGASYREISQLTGASEAGVRSRIFRARRALRARLRPSPNPANEEIGS